ncbi:MAG: SMI1/KNR4 family protein [Bryobacteraceae bacterium]|jgi:hypothetical protein
MRTKAIQALQDALGRVDNAGSLRPAAPEDIKRAKEAGFPQELLELYADHEPSPDKTWVQLRQRIWCIAHALVENRNAVPGLGVFPHGYVVFASNMCGDGCCIDTNVRLLDGQHPVVLFPHDSIDEHTDLAYIEASRVEVASSLDEFLLKFAAGTLIEEPYYPPR